MESISTTTATTPVAAPEEPVSPKGPAIFQPLRLRDFRLVFTGESISLIGDQFHFVALAWLALQLTGSGLALGTVLMVAAIPRAVFMLLGGALSDRFSPRSLMLASNALRGVVVGIVATLVLSGNAELWQLYVLAGIFGVVDAFFHPALNTIVPMLVSERQLPPANALVQIMQQLSGLIGPAIAGLVIAAFQTGPAFAVDAISFGVATVTMALVRGGRRTPHSQESADEPRRGLLGDIGSGLSYAWGDPAVRSLVLLSAAFNFAFSGPISVGLPYLADHRFAGGAALFGLMLSTFGAGAVAGALLAGSMKHVPQLGAVVLVIAFVMGLGLAIIGLSPNVYLTLAAGLLIGLGAGFINVRVVAWLQQRTPEALRGRVMSLVLLGAVGLQPIGLGVAGAIIDLGAVSLMFAVAGGIILAAVTAGWLAGVPGQMLDEAAA
ncbi:MAG TPA: MFS transporter [Candidatus Limnocylindria bacterium]